MMHVVSTRVLICCLAVLPAGRAFTQNPSSQANPQATVSASDVAHVYVGTPKGVYLYRAASNGKLTLEPGSPFKTAGMAIGSTGKYFITVGTAYAHSYAIASNGAIGEQMSQTNTQNYTGSDCGSPTAAIFDRTGQNLYVQLNKSRGVGECVAYQTFDIAKASGALTFHGAAVRDTDYYKQGLGLAITADNQFVYAPNSFHGAPAKLSALRRESDGTLEFTNINETDPPPPFQGSGPNQAFIVAADSTNHLAVGLADPSFENLILASYTIDRDGDIASTNTINNYEISLVFADAMQISPSGKLLAVGCNDNYPPLQLFHFNGADPITPYSANLTNDLIDQVQWDKDNHLYALSESSKKLHVYTVTPTTIAEAPGSPYVIASPNGLNALVVVSSSCPAPDSDGVHICLPARGSSVSSPVRVEAAAKITGTIANTQLWVDGVKKYSTASTSLTDSIGLSAGTHRFAVLATNTAGQKWESVSNLTVK
jgi:hypothetical protein